MAFILSIIPTIIWMSDTIVGKHVLIFLFLPIVVLGYVLFKCYFYCPDPYVAANGFAELNTSQSE